MAVVGKHSRSVKSSTFSLPILLVLSGFGIAELQTTACSSPFHSCSERRTCAASAGRNAAEAGDTGDAGAGDHSDGGSGGVLGTQAGSAGVADDDGGAAGQASACGDGLVEGGEACDDGNSVAKDGCFKCTVEATFKCDDESPSHCQSTLDCATGTSCGGHGQCSDVPGGGHTCACGVGYSASAGTCVRTSCVGAEGTECQGGDCCVSPSVPGGKFKFGGAAGTTAATVTTFALDKFEVNVGRFRRFVAQYSGHPAAGAGAHPLIAGSGWQSAWDSSIPGDKAALAKDVANANGQWDASGANDSMPTDWVTWYEAFAFCAWDGGRLPTEVEWEYAAAGGSDERIYPWGDTPTPTGMLDTSAEYAVYACLGGGAAQGCSVRPVGSRPKGIGKYGQLDLAGSALEWVLDQYAQFGPTCENCAHLSGDGRSTRGGYYSSNEQSLRSTERDDHDATIQSSGLGFRCAR